MNKACHILALFMLGGIASGEATHDPNALFRGRVSELVCKGSAIVAGLNGPHKDDLIVVDDVNDLSQMPRALRQLLSSVVEMHKSVGVVSLGSMSYDNEAKDVWDVTFRLYVFRDRPSCEAWRKQKYEPQG